jgi:hypothetical protein
MSDTTTTPTSDSENTADPKRWRDLLPVHPAAELFPLMSEDELRELADDIKKNNGCLREKVSLWDDPDRGTCLIDGRNRLDALQLLGEVEKPDQISGVYEWVSPRNFDPYAYVISKNIQRRHLTPEQRRDLIAKVLKARPEVSNRRIAAELKVDHKKVAAVRRVGEATGEISPVEKTTGKDGRTRPVRRANTKGRKQAHKPASNAPPNRPSKPVSEWSVDEFMERTMAVGRRIGVVAVVKVAILEIAKSDPARARQCVERIIAELHAAIDKAINDTATHGQPQSDTPTHEQMLHDDGLPEGFIRSRGQ